MKQLKDRIQRLSRIQRVWNAAMELNGTDRDELMVRIIATYPGDLSRCPFCGSASAHADGTHADEVLAEEKS